MNMKHLRLLASIIILICAGQVTRAQLVRFNVGIEAGALGGYMMTESRLSPGFDYGGYGGANIEVRIGRIFGVFGEAVYSYQTGKQTLLTDDGFSSGVRAGITRQYMHIPLGIQLWMGRAALFQAGFQQSILLSSRYSEEGMAESISPDEGALKYYTSIMAGFKFNLGRVVYINVEGTYGLSPAYVVTGHGAPVITASVGLGFRVYSYRKSAFK